MPKGAIRNGYTEALGRLKKVDDGTKAWCEERDSEIRVVYPDGHFIYQLFLIGYVL